MGNMKTENRNKIMVSCALDINPKDIGGLVKIIFSESLFRNLGSIG